MKKNITIRKGDSLEITITTKDGSFQQFIGIDFYKEYPVMDIGEANIEIKNIGGLKDKNLWRVKK